MIPDFIDLDQNATTPLDPSVLEAMRPHWLAGGNPESRHAAGRRARRALIGATEVVARILNARPDEVVFTSGGTEANNLAILGLAGAPGRVVATAMEHPAVAEPLNRLAARGWDVRRVPVGADGVADASIMANMFDEPTTLSTLILAHNETGAIQPVGELSASANLRGIPVHTDAVQAVGRIPVDFHGLGVATLAASAHKFHGPAGVGLLLIKKGVRLIPHTVGGGQQGGIRPGTVPVALCVGLASALENWARDSDSRIARWVHLRGRLEAGIVGALGRDRVVRHGPTDDAHRLPQTLHLGFPGLDGDALLIRLDLAGVAASMGSACASGSGQPSPTLVAMAAPADTLRSSVRFSLGANTTEADVDETIRRIAQIAQIAH